MSTESPTSLNAQDFSGSDDEILDNFSEGPDDGTPMGVGGDKGKQSEPASSTLEADIANGTTSGETLPPDDTAASEPIKDASEKGPETTPEPESETPEFPPALLQMAGLTDAASAQAAGFNDPASLFAAVKWRSQLLTPGAQPAQPSDQGLYRSKSEPPQTTAPAPAPDQEGEVKPFQLPTDKMDMLDEDLQDVIRQMNDHYEQQVTTLQSSLKQRDAVSADQQAQDEEVQFDEAIQSLDGWKDVFGEGGGRDLASKGQSDPAAMTSFNHRALLFEAVQAVREVNAKQGYKPMPLEQEVQWALMQRYPDKFQQTISGKSNGPRPGVTASRPTQRNTPPSAKEKVLNDLNKKYPNAGFTSQDAEDFDGEI